MRGCGIARWAASSTRRKLLLADWLLLDLHRARGRTMFEGIAAVPGGTIVTVEADGTTTQRRYWRPHADPVHEGRDEAYYVRAYRDVLSEAVACRLRRTVAPAGMLFGGGFDSTAIAGLARPVMEAQQRQLACAAAVMPEDYEGPIRHARPWVEMVRGAHPHIAVRYVTRDGLDAMTGAAQAFLREGLPHGPNRYVNDALYRAVADSGACVVMDGHGGDYTLNPRAATVIPDHLRRGRLRAFWHEFAAYARQPGQSWFKAARFVARDLAPGLRAMWQRLRRRSEAACAESMFNPDYLAAAKRNGVRSPRDRAGMRRPAKREGMLRTLEAISGGFAMGGAIPAAHHGLELTQPYHDKRVVEFALAVPEALYFRHGRERHLARLALADIYPPAFATRDSHNDDRTPDFPAVVRRCEPQLLAEIARMEKSEYLASIFDFANIRQHLIARPAGKRQAERERETVHAVAKLLCARFVEWFSRANT